MSDKPKKDEKADKKDGDGHGADEKKDGKKGGLLSKTPVLMAIAMVVEAGVLVGGFKFMGGGAKPAAAETAEGADEHGEGGDAHGDKKEGDAHGEPEKKDAHGGGDAHGAPAADAKPAKKDKKKAVEIPVIEARFPNKVSGRTLLFDLAMVVRVRGDKEDAAKGKIADNKALISDRVRTIIAQSDPEKLAGGSEPGLETLRRQVKYQLDDVLGDGVVDEVLVPRCIPFRADF